MVARLFDPSRKEPSDELKDRIAAIEKCKSVSDFLERTAVSMGNIVDLVKEMDAEVVRLRYEIAAAENEYQNLKTIVERMESQKKQA
jgi:hypothetical protein